MKHVIPCQEYQWLLQLSVVVSQSLNDVYLLNNAVLCAPSVESVQLNSIHPFVILGVMQVQIPSDQDVQ